MQIDIASHDDWSRVAELQEMCFPEDPTQIDEPEFRDLIAGEGGSVLVARTDECFAGYIVMRRRSFLPWESVAFMVVDPRFRGRGVGTLLTEAASRQAQRPFLRLHVRPSNTAALNIYRKLGFRVIGSKESNYSDGEDALIMMCWNGLPISRPSPPEQVGDAAA